MRIGYVYNKIGQSQEALNYYQQALPISREVGDRPGEAVTLNNLGTVYTNIGQPQEALNYYQQALPIRREVGDRPGEARTLNNLGAVYRRIGQPQEALNYYQQALPIMREVGDRPGEAVTLNNLGFLLEAEEQPQLAIIFFKQSVNRYEAIRENIRQLPPEQQQAYTETIAHTYRRLADLLLQQDRILEAQRVLDLLKVQEIDDYLRGVRGNDNIRQGVPNSDVEQQIWRDYEDLLDQAVTLGKELTQLRQERQHKGSLTPAQEQRLAQLVAAEGELKAQFVHFSETREIETLIAQLTSASRKPDLVDELDKLLNIQDNLRDLQQNAVLFYPLVLEKRLELILTTPDSLPIHRTVKVDREELKQAILDFRKALDDNTSNPQPLAEKLYQWLIQPLAKDLQTADARTLIYAPDSLLRYIPLAALHDGNQWLVERFRINDITATSLTDLNAQPPQQLQVLAGAMTQKPQSIQIGQETFNFASLPHAGTEVASIGDLIPQTTQLLDRQFSKAKTIPEMDNYTIVHLATHAAFVVGTPKDSFILFGDEERVTLEEVKLNWKFNNVSLIVLSACETGVGGNFGGGEEILSFGYLMETAGARATIASLWPVSDGGTKVFMATFYAALQQGLTKAEALQRSQAALIADNFELLEDPKRGIVQVRQRVREGVKPEVTSRLGHPYYWAPFILIGNGL